MTPATKGLELHGATNSGFMVPAFAGWRVMLVECGSSRIIRWIGRERSPKRSEADDGAQIKLHDQFRGAAQNQEWALPRLLQRRT